MKFTFEDYVKAYNGDGDSLVKLINYREYWFNHNSQPWCIIDIFDFTSDEIKKIVELDDNYNNVVNAVNSYSDSVIDGTIKFRKFSCHPLRNSVTKWLKKTNISDKIMYLYYNRLSLSIYGVEHSLGTSISLNYYEIANKMINALINKAKDYMTENDLMVSLNRKAFKLYNDLNLKDGIFEHIGWTTSGYKNCGSSLIIYDEASHKNRFLTKEELDNVVLICETMMSKLNEISSAFKSKVSFNY